MMARINLIPGQIQIRAHLTKLRKRFHERGERAIAYDYDQGVRDALLWVLNGGEPPATLDAVPYLKRRCRECGCTEADCAHCIQRTGKACHWVDADLCSACAPEVKS